MRDNYQICLYSVALLRLTVQELLINLSHKLFTNGYHQWRFCVPVRVGLKLIVTLHGVVVGLNGGFVQIAQLGANCLSGVECQAWYEKPQP